MPKLWEATLDGHKSAVRRAVTAAVSELVDQGGLNAVTMSAVAQRAGIGRATLYKHFEDLEAVLLAWHADAVGRHVTQLRAHAVGAASALDRLRAVLGAYAQLTRHDPAGAAGVTLHQGTHVSQARLELVALVATLAGEGIAAGDVRSDVDAELLAEFCIASMGAARHLDSEAARDRLLDLTLDALRPSRES